MEILIVVAILGVVAITAVPLYQPNFTSQLENAAEVVMADLARARSLAVANNSKYELVFSDIASSYYLHHNGTSASLATLPSSAYGEPDDPADRQTTLLTSLPAIDDVELVGVVSVTATARNSASAIEFDGLGGITSIQTTEIWLAAGSGIERRYISITINPITGLSSVGEITGTAPTISGTAGSGSAGVSLDLGFGS